MRRGLTIALVVSLAAAGCAPRANDVQSAQPGPAAGTPAQPSTFPQTSGCELAEQSCQMCHSASLTTQQAKDSTAWEKTLGTMIKWGAPVDSTERDSLRAYLVREFGPRKKS